VFLTDSITKTIKVIKIKLIRLQNGSPGL